MSTLPAAVTVGVFDGFHRGHARVLERARARADAAAGRLVAVTFDRHPQSVLSPRTGPPALASRAETVDRLREAGADEVRVVRFDAALAAKAPLRFLADHVFPFHRLAALVVGHDFAMGRERRGTAAALAGLGRRFGFRVESVDAVIEGGEAVSSSRIRGLLAAGDVAAAARCLGRPYALGGTVVPGEGRGRTLGFPTANLAVDLRRLRPARGVYAVRVAAPGLEAPGVANIGLRPTFGEGVETVEVHLFGSPGDLVGIRLSVTLVERLRPELKFKDANELKQQIRRDAARARFLLGEGGNGQNHLEPRGGR